MSSMNLNVHDITDIEVKKTYFSDFMVVTVSCTDVDNDKSEFQMYVKSGKEHKHIDSKIKEVR